MTKFADSLQNGSMLIGYRSQAASWPHGHKLLATMTNTAPANQRAGHVRDTILPDWDHLTANQRMNRSTIIMNADSPSKYEMV